MCHSKPHPTLLTTDELLAECDARRLRRSGPGGQHRNKVETAVALVHRPTGVRAEANERRSQAQNRTVAVFRLRLKLALAVRAARDKHTAPSPLWRSRCHGGRIAVNPSHDDFPAMLAEALDVIAAVDADVKTAAETLGCSASQLVTLLRKEPRAMTLLNDWRRRRGLGPLR